MRGYSKYAVSTAEAKREVVIPGAALQFADHPDTIANGGKQAPQCCHPNLEVLLFVPAGAAIGPVPTLHRPLCRSAIQGQEAELEAEQGPEQATNRSRTGHEQVYHAQIIDLLRGAA